MTAVPLASVLLQIPGSMVVEFLGGGGRSFFIWTVTPHQAMHVLVGLLPWGGAEGCGVGGVGDGFSCFFCR